MYSLLLSELRVFPKVSYNISVWLKKNEDILKGRVVAIFQKSSNRRLENLFVNYISTESGESNNLPSFFSLRIELMVALTLTTTLASFLWYLSAPWSSCPLLLAFLTSGWWFFKEMVLKDRYISRSLLWSAFIFCSTQMQRESSKPCFEKEFWGNNKSL